MKFKIIRIQQLSESIQRSYTYRVGMSKKHYVNKITIIVLGREFETVGP